MFWPFKKKKQFDDKFVKKQICDYLDWFLDKTFKQSINVKDRLLTVRNDIVNSKIPENVGNEILEILNRFKMQSISLDSMNLMIEEVQLKMFNVFKKKKQKNADEKNKELIEQLSLEIKECELRLNFIDSEIKNALALKQKTKWQLLSQEKHTLDAKIRLKKNSLNSLILKQANKEIDIEAKKQQEITEHLQNTDNYVDTDAISDRINESNVVMNDIKGENSAVMNAVYANNTFDDDFDKAYEQYLLDSANNVDEAETLIRKEDK